MRSPERVADEMQQVARTDQGSCFFFTDSILNTPHDHALALCHEIARRRPRITWMAYCNPCDFDRELADAMASAGCMGVEFGLDAATEKMLEAHGKPFNQDDIRKSFEAASAVELPFAAHLLFGGPGETPQDIAETQEFLDSCATPNAVFASLGIRIYESTALEQTARYEGLLPPDADLFAPTYYVSPELGDDPMAVLDSVVRRRIEWSSPTDWAKWSMRLIRHMANRMQTRPQWRDARNYGKYMRW